MRQVDDQAAVGEPERALQIARAGRMVLAGHAHAGQRLEAAVVALGVDDRHRVTGEHELFRQQAGDPRFARSRIAADEDVAIAHRQREGPVGIVSQQQTTPAVGGREIAQDGPRAQEAGDVGRSAPVEDQIRHLA